MLPPRHVYSAIVKNESDKDATVTATYEVPAADNTTTTAEAQITVAAGAEGKFEEKTVVAGTATLIGNITSIAVAGGSKVTGPFVSGPTKDFVFTIAADLTIAH